MALALYEKGLFAWSEWSAMLGEEIKKARASGDPDTGEAYYHHWLATLERMVAEKARPQRRRSRSITKLGSVPCIERRTADPLS